MSLVRWLLFTTLCATAALADPNTDRELAQVRNEYEFGKHEACYQRATARIQAERQKARPDPALLAELHKYAGVSALNLGRTQEAEKQLFALLQLEPDYALDPFVFPPPAVSYLEKLKASNATLLGAIREAKQQRAEQERREAERRAREEADRQARLRAERERLEAMQRPPRVLERRSYWVNFVPFGAGQFQQGRTKAGVALAASEGLLAAASVFSFWRIETLVDRSNRTELTDTVTPQSYSDPGIPAARQQEVQVLNAVKWGAGIGFYVLWAIGSGEALYRHEDLVEVSNGSAASPTSVGPPAPSLTAPFLFSTEGGAGAGIGLRF